MLAPNLRQIWLLGFILAKTHAARERRPGRDWQNKGSQALVDEKDLLLREVDEEVRRERLLQWWKQYGGWVIGLVVLAVTATAAWQYWHWRTERLLDADSARFETARRELQAEKVTPAEAAKRWQALSQKFSSDVYRSLASIKAAAALSRAGEFEAVEKAWNELAEQAPDERLRYHARLNEASAALARGANDRARAILEPMAVPENPFYHAVLELLGGVALAGGERDEARARWQAIADDPAAPPALRNRVGELIALLDEKAARESTSAKAGQAAAMETANKAEKGS